MPRRARTRSCLKSTRPYGVLVTGVGGTGVVTIGELLGMAAHLEGKGVTVLDVDRPGAERRRRDVATCRSPTDPGDIHATRIATGEADLVIGCDPIVTASDECGSRMQPNHTRVVVNSDADADRRVRQEPELAASRARAAEADIRAAAGEHVALRRREPLRRRAARRRDRHEPVRARLRVAARLGAAASRGARCARSS